MITLLPTHLVEVPAPGFEAQGHMINKIEADEVAADDDGGIEAEAGGKSSQQVDQADVDRVLSHAPQSMDCLRNVII